MNFIINRAAIEDAAEILALQRLAYRSEAELYGDYQIQPLTQTMKELVAEFQTHVIFKAILGTSIMGSVRARMSGNTCHIGKLLVAPQAQNQGIGTALIRHVEGAHNGVNRFELFTGDKSEKNLHLYRKLGYNEYKRERANAGLVFVFLEKHVLPC